MPEAATERLARVDALFDRALDLPPEERAALLEAAAREEPDLVAEVRALLAHAADEAPGLDPAAVAAGPLWRELAVELAAQEPPAPAPGAATERWRLLEELGRGGMGTVYLAERADGELEQRAALKLLHPGLASEQALRRFERERRILAGLDHPGIARVLDGGRTADGRPYLAMELVAGRPLDRYCDEERLGVRERLGLFVQVGRAVEHAHRNLVVHRDLKPSNIVVGDGGEVKLLDFGIAKLLAPEAPDEPLTRTMARVLTPEYASPEQVLGGPITVASDVYQLGLLLYELLSGRRPYRVAGSSALEIERAVCHAEPRRPSAEVAAPAAEGCAEASPEQIARRRRTTPKALGRRLRGDLDTITLQALRKEPERRYPSVARLVEDVERHLAGRPVEARGDGLAYRASRFVARHRVGVAAAAALFLLVGAWALSATLQGAALGRERDRARAEAVKAREVTAFVLDLFRVADPEHSRGETLTARQLLDRGAARLEEELAGQPVLRAELLSAVGEIYRRLGVYEEAEGRLRQALAAVEELGQPLEQAEVLNRLGHLLRDRGDPGAAAPLLERALALREQGLGSAHPLVAETLDTLSRVRRDQGELDRAEALARQALELRRAALGDQHRETLTSLNNLGLVLWRRGDYAAAEAAFRQALEARRRILPQEDIDLVASIANLALILQTIGRDVEAAGLFREALMLYRRVLGEDHPHVAMTLGNLAGSLRSQGELGSAEAVLREALEVRRRSLGERHPQVAMSFSDLGLVVQEQGRIEEAEAYYREALARYPEDHPWRSSALLNLASVEEARGRPGRAEEIYRELLARDGAALGEDHPTVALRQARLGALLARQGRGGEAEPLLRAALATFEDKLPADHVRLAEALVPLGELLCRSGDAVEGERLAAEGHRLRRQRLGGEDPRTAEAALALDSCRAARVRSPGRSR